MTENISYFARTDFRDERLFGIKQADRHLHMYILGRTGTGKTHLILLLCTGDYLARRGFCLIDPLGDLVEALQLNMPPESSQKAIYLNLTDENQPWKYNPLKNVKPELRPLVTGGILGVLEGLFRSSWGSRLEHLLRKNILTLLECPDSSFIDIIPMFVNDQFRQKMLSNVRSKKALKFWSEEFPLYDSRSFVPIVNKIGSFLAYPNVRKLLCENERELRLRTIMDEGTILLVNLARGRIGEDAASLVGSLLITSIGHAAFSRADTPESLRKPYTLYVDESQSFQGSKLHEMLSLLRKYKTSVVLASQFLDQYDERTRNSILGNVGTFVSFRIGAKDATLVSRELLPVFEPEHLVRLPNYHIALKLSIDGAPSKPFTAKTIRASEIPGYPKCKVTS